ncbi:MAG: sigma-70 family RNA polymerase sigma factor [Candidatus Kuenenia stuttgartiensis]|nr:sigma-70 family RNA polymerase sigma factor [Candidatus Kuenenia stuttgartiensis]
MPQYQPNNQDNYAIAFSRGDEQALAHYFRDLHPALTFYANQWVRDFHLAQEIAADAFVKTWKAHCQFDSYDSIKRYLYTIVRRDSYKIAKRLNVHPFSTTQSEEGDAADNDTPFSNLVRAETYHILYSALKKLSPGNSRVITMYYLEGKTTGEIARELNLHPSTVQTQKIRGIKGLQKLLKLHVFWVIFLLTKIFFPTL